MPQEDLQKLALLLNAEIVNQAAGLSVSSIAMNTTEIQEGGLFVALRGSSRDGHEFVQAALEAGAVAALVEDPSFLCGSPGLVVPDTRKSLALLAAHWFGNPTKQLQMVGVTGTNGKTTITWLIEHLLQSCGRAVVRVGTLGIGATRGEYPQIALTTPDVITLQKIFAVARDNSIDCGVMEVSSHALDQLRAEGLDFDVGVFTNLTHDHLDYHGSEEEYFKAKSHLFDLVQSSSGHIKTAVINIDCPWGKKLSEDLPAGKLKIFRCGEDPSAEFVLKSFEQDYTGSVLSLEFADAEFEVKSKFLGRFNAYNLLQAFAVGVALGISPDEIALRLENVPQVPGRMELVPGGDAAVFVDFSHTPDALRSALIALRDVAKSDLWVVFGCGGERDAAKRPEMGLIAAEYADRVVVTSDNPRREPPENIINDILACGISAEIVEVDRRSAIFKTLRAAKEGDLVLIAGKGHESYQDIGGVKRSFSDQQVVRDWLAENK